MTRADRLCIIVAVLPVGMLVSGLLGTMVVRSATGASPFPDGSANYVLPASLLVTFGAVLAANLLRIRVAHLRR
ncbi:hypothetical protein FHS94_001623 [Sphingomonas aerophila]|uniref:Uncharacterized protein n=1 Tax=Sphingomonas aerophila TaxID=1344948 RepID=A0A7W9EVJ7_9SPHN|nr:hypothetical protein [Sphingomonas aerophila]